MLFLQNKARNKFLGTRPYLRVQVQDLGEASGAYSLSPPQQELVFMGERCVDTKKLSDYGICEKWIIQVCYPEHVTQNCILSYNFDPHASNEADPPQ